MKDQLIFDTTETADSDNVGAYVRAGDDGAQIGSQAINAENWLNTASVLHDENGAVINDANPLPVDLVSPISVTVDLDGIYNVGTNADPDNVGMIMHTRAASLTDAEQVERTTAGAVASIAAASIANINAIDTNSFMFALNDVSGDAELLSKDDTSDGLNVHLAGSDISLDTNDSALADTAILAAANDLAVASTSESVVGSALANRKYLYVYNNFNKKMYIGQSGVTESTGFPVSPGSYLEMRAGAAIDVHFVSDTISHTIRTLELS